MLEKHCTQTAQLSQAGCSHWHKIMYLAVKKGNPFVNILLLKTVFTDNCHLYTQLNNIYVSLAIVDTAIELCHKGDLFLKRRMKGSFGIYAYFR